ncbi:glutathione S-transferase family protein [Leptolyngbya sp. CCNP1308]|uniref:glutathione S-transferase family protein n=1 Tax=Leptolyngbya sp. CCNP1308 TaxID=3110255 RepID=UPI002B20318A|nr:glutathione S-transferase family protein [Leptolyngbya sp. CCNP1308]MEA5449081.1 glutathione S-transferase family protein [Leptolyngbya sp. CCNP1308]
MYRLYDYPPSGNGYKVRLLLSHLGLPFEYVALDILKGETRTAEFLAKNPNGRIPLLELEPGSYLAESNAILFYLAQSTPFWPTAPLSQAEVMRWLFFEQYSHEPNIATPRFWLCHLDELNAYQQAALPYKQEQGYQALAVMEQHLGQHAFLVDESYTIADMALYAYTHVAHEGGFELDRFPAVRRWLAQIAAQPNHVPITQTTFEF